jgi:hypothetical protein
VTSHFTGVTQFLLAELAPEGAELELTCEYLAGGACTESFNVSPASGDPRLAEVPLSFNLSENTYVFGLKATLGGMESGESELTVELRPGVGELKCEQSTNGLPGNSEVRWLGLRLQTSGGQPIANADYYLYDRATTGRGWSEYDTLEGADKLVVSGGSSDFSASRTFQAIAVDRGTTPATAVAAREFRYGQLPSGLTRGCTNCSIGPSGSCDIIPLE